MDALKELNNSVYVWWKAAPDSDKNEYLGIIFESENEHYNTVKAIKKDERLQQLVSMDKLHSLSFDEMSSLILSELLKSDWNWINHDVVLFKEDVHLLCEGLI
ncbi:MAG: hypothetical protein Q4G63_11470 [Bacteroidia bacterium]|nr:hypothetical protein [Bacteroidia bacterium]